MKPIAEVMIFWSTFARSVLKIFFFRYLWNKYLFDEIQFDSSLLCLDSGELQNPP